jgi:hypothetical protein
MDNIKLRKVGDQEPKKLPRGVRLLVIGNRAMFVKTVMGKVFPVSDEEQKRLRDEYGT